VKTRRFRQAWRVLGGRRHTTDDTNGSAGSSSDRHNRGLLPTALARLAWALIACLGPLPALAQNGPATILETIPADAEASLSLHNLKDLEVRGQALLRELEAPNHWQLATWYRGGLNFLGIKQGIDDSGTFSIALMPPETKEDRDQILELLVFRVPYTDADEMGQNFGLSAGELAPGKVHNLRKKLLAEETIFLAIKDNALILSVSERAIEMYLASPSLASRIPGEIDEQLGAADMLLHVNAHNMLRLPSGDSSGLERLLARMPHFEREEVRRASREMAHAAEHFLWGNRLDGGANMTFRLTFDQELLSPETRQLLAAWGGRTRAPDVRGLPPGNLAFAISKTANGLKHPEEVRQLLHWLVLGPGHWTHLLPIAEPLLAPKPDSFQEVFDEIWNSLEDARVGGYFNRRVEEQGLLSLLAILHPQDPRGFIDDLAGLIKYSRGASYNPRTMREEQVTREEIEQLITQLGADEFRIRKAATLRLKLLGEPALEFLEKSKESPHLEVAARSRHIIEHVTKSMEERQQRLIRDDLSAIPLPTFVLFENQQRIAGYRVDLLQAQWAEDSPELRARVRELFGPQGDEILLVHTESRIVVFLGSDRELLEACLELLRADDAGFDRDVELFRRHAGGTHLVEFHFSQQRLRPLLPEHIKRRIGDLTRITPAVTSMGIEVGPARLRLDLTIPTSELRDTFRVLGLLF
jgi:hypothetical protein